MIKRWFNIYIFFREKKLPGPEKILANGRTAGLTGNLLYWLGLRLITAFQTWSMLSHSLDISSTLFTPGSQVENQVEKIFLTNFCCPLDVLKTWSTSRLVWTWWRCCSCSSSPACDLPSTRWRVRFCSPSYFFPSWPPLQKNRLPSSIRALPSKPLPR